VKNLAFAVALLIAALGAAGALVPSYLVWIAEHSATAGAFYVIAAVRVALGLLLISAAPHTRMPRTIHALGWVALIAGVLTALIGLVDMDRARALIAWWMQQGSGVLRLTGVLVLAVGGFIAWACAPARHGGA
jgi:hypothetical protein